MYAENGSNIRFIQNHSNGLVRIYIRLIAYIFDEITHLTACKMRRRNENKIKNQQNFSNI